MIKKNWVYIISILALLFSFYYLSSKNKYQERVKNDTSSAATVRSEESIEKNPENKKIYIVKSGDTLWDIAEKNYGSGFKYHEIISKNPNKTFKFKNGENGLIYPGTELEL